MYVIVKNALYVCIVLNLCFKLRAWYTLRMWQHSVCIAWSFARFCLNRQRSSGSVKGKYTKYRLHIASLRFYAFSNMRSQISSSFLRHGHLPIREVNCYRRLFQFASRRVLRQIFFSGWLLVRLASFRRGTLRMGEEHWRLLLRLHDSIHGTVVLPLQIRKRILVS